MKKIHLIFKTHLDVGFTDFSRKVVAQYFNSFIPKALDLAEKLRREGGLERFLWTTGSWLIYEYLEKAPAPRRRRMENAILERDIAWHGLPFTFQSETMDADLFRFGLGLSKKLDRRFGRRTIAAKMTDVPGHTRGIVPLLAEAGIEFLHVGVNGASTAPDVPELFVWRDKASRAQVTVACQKGAYGGFQELPGGKEAFQFVHTGDNLGPSSLGEVKQAYKQMGDKFPGARILASTLDNVALALRPLRKGLPVFSGEIGDTWIHGAATDPAKMAAFRQMLRLRRDWMANGAAKRDPEKFERFSRHLLMVPEHTWGMDTKLHLRDYENYTAAQLRRLRRKNHVRGLEASWKEQRDYISSAVKALGPGPLGLQARRAIQSLKPDCPTGKGMRLVKPGTVFKTAQFEIAFSPADGSIQYLRQKSNGRLLADAGHVLGRFSYQTFSGKDYDRFLDQYAYNAQTRAWEWFIRDFSKPGLPASCPHRTWEPGLACLKHGESDLGDLFLAELKSPAKAVSQFGMPRLTTMSLFLPKAVPAVLWDLQWFGKPACRMPEALWLSFNPRVAKPAAWLMGKMGTLVSPLEVVAHGSRHLHAVDSGVHYSGPGGSLSLGTVDSCLVAPGEKSLLDFNQRQPDLKKGMHFLLCDNIWGTNFPQWYEEDARFRFLLSCAAFT